LFRCKPDEAVASVAHRRAVSVVVAMALHYVGFAPCKVGVDLVAGMAEPSEYLCTLQPPVGSTLALKLEKLRAVCQQAHGVDATGLYPPHVSVSGFFSATAQQASMVCQEVIDFVLQAPPGSLDVLLQNVISTNDGHVIFVVVAPGVAKLAKRLGERADDLGVRLRPKPVRHMSLASGRLPFEQQRIAKMYSDGVPSGFCQLDFVVSQRLHIADTQSFQCSGMGHRFRELLRVPLPSASAGCEEAEGMPYTSTPVKKRSLGTYCDEGSTTPEAVSASRAGEKRRRQDECGLNAGGTIAGAAETGVLEKKRELMRRHTTDAVVLPEVLPRHSLAS